MKKEQQPQQQLLVLTVILLISISCAIATNDTVTSLPGISLKTRTLSGYIDIDPSLGVNMYYLFFESQGNPATDPVVLWLQGGPGCSSLFGAFVENGPYIIDSAGNFSPNQWSWNTNASLIYIDNPVGTGFSYLHKKTGYVTNEIQMATDMYETLEGFFALHPEYSTQDFYIFGESYAGKYVPYLASYIVNQTNTNINLKGVGMGDGWTDPYYQAGSYGPFMYLNNRISSEQLDKVLTKYKTFQELYNNGKISQAEALDNEMLNDMMIEGDAPNPYDIRYKRDPTNGPTSALTRYLNRAEVQTALYVSDITWSDCGNAPYNKLGNDEELSARFLFPHLFEEGLIVLLYSGQYDLICDFIGTDSWSSAIVWPGQSGYNSAANQTWTVGSQTAGYFKSFKPLAHVVVYNAGHMSPFDQPENTHAMLYRFISGGFFSN
eukprot:TRINITY_DN2401_c0_g1_i2.p1 TRINITY_DN2401_c0_g1~~TRINITY_DN2401_c0_g1_i2.p1  ORF type:complete len:446 (-),score=92.17 TRINITY_DN2401_c0_g1_i2:55-1359(-)